MTRTTCLVPFSLVSLLSLAVLITGCPSADDAALPPPKDGGADSAIDSSSNENGTDVAESGDSVGETGVGCGAAGDIDKRACGKCGTQFRTCGAGGVWKDWQPCDGEKIDAECAIGETRDGTCGNCGTEKDTCDPTACTWSLGSCT